MNTLCEQNLFEGIRRVISEPSQTVDLFGDFDMKFFIDCEYNGLGGQLLSIALVPENIGLEPFYREQLLTEPIHPWVYDHVFPKLQQCKGIEEYNQHCTLEQLQSDLIVYLNQFDRIHLIADWPDDIKYFCELLITGPGTRIDTPPLTMEIRRDLDYVSQNPHQSLADAVAMRDKYMSILLQGK